MDGSCDSHSLSGVGLDGVQEAAVLILGADETDAVEGRVVQAPLVALHLHRQEVVPRDRLLIWLTSTTHSSLLRAFFLLS